MAAADVIQWHTAAAFVQSMRDPQTPIRDLNFSAEQAMGQRE